VRTWFAIWMFASMVIACIDDQRSRIEGDDRPWYGRAIFALLAGGIYALLPGLACLVLHAP
jgi:hypothetical protein